MVPADHRHRRPGREHLASDPGVASKVTLVPDRPDLGQFRRREIGETLEVRADYPAEVVRPPSTRESHMTREDSVITLFIVDDHEIVRRGLADLLQAHPRMKIVGEAGSAADALHRIPAVHPDVALLDVRLPDGSGVDVCRDIRSQTPETRCLMLTSFDDDNALFAAVMAGASGYLLKRDPRQLTDRSDRGDRCRAVADRSFPDRAAPAAAA